MKKITQLSMLILTTFFTHSCKRVYRCECTGKTTTGVYARTRKAAKEQCVKEYWDPVFEKSVTCWIDG